MAAAVGVKDRGVPCSYERGWKWNEILDWSNSPALLKPDGEEKNGTNCLLPTYHPYQTAPSHDRNENFDFR